MHSEMLEKRLKEISDAIVQQQSNLQQVSTHLAMLEGAKAEVSYWIAKCAEKEKEKEENNLEKVA